MTKFLALAMIALTLGIIYFSTGQKTPSLPQLTTPIISLPAPAPEKPLDLSQPVLISGVPWTPQAPLAEWGDDRQQEACEEASALIAVSWAKGVSGLTREVAKDQILAISEFESQKYGGYQDTSAADTMNRIVKGYFKYDKVKLLKDVTADDLIRELHLGNLLITPMNGQALGNPHFTQPGPPRHMLVVIGFDPARNEFITKEVGVKEGDNYRYPKEVFYNAIRDYATGNRLPIVGVSKVAIVVSK